jgi:hypothetical protein
VSDVKTRYVNLFIDPNPNCPEGCDLRFSACGDARPVAWVRREDGTVCDVAGWSSRGGGTPCPAFATPVEDSGAGVSILVHGGDWGLRLTPRDGGPPAGEPYLLLADAGECGDESRRRREEVRES